MTMFEISSDSGILDIFEAALLLCAGALLAAVYIHRLKAYRALLIGSGLILLITALYPRAGNRLGLYLFGPAAEVMRLPDEVFGVLWWILGAWLVKSALALILRRTLFPNDNQPHARRLFADLATGLVYVVAFVGIMDTVLKQPISTVLATSGVLAIVFGLALQNTLSDVFAGLAINVERPFRSGDWITVNGLAEGQVMEINWRATRIKTTSNDIIVMPNSVIAKAVVTNHRRLTDPLWRGIAVSVDHAVEPSRVTDALELATRGAAGLSQGVSAVAYARGITDSLVQYDLCIPVDNFADIPLLQSDIVKRLVSELNRVGIPIGAAPTEVRLLSMRSAGVAEPLSSDRAEPATLPSNPVSQ
jgi:small-conductance mechanosensitive channel